MNDILQHSLLAIAYRFDRAIQGTSGEFGSYTMNDHTRTPSQIISHMFDLASKTILMINEGHFSQPKPDELSYDLEVSRFKNRIKDLRALLAKEELPLALSKKLLQGPLLDMTSHVGQLALLRGISGDPVPWVSYFSADLR